MTASTSTDTQQPPATNTVTAGAEEWSEAFGNLDLDRADDSDTQHSTSTSISTQQPLSSVTAAATIASSDKLNVIEPLWFLHTDELSATEAYTHDTKSRIREILSFRVDRSVSSPAFCIVLP